MVVLPLNLLILISIINITSQTIHIWLEQKIEKRKALKYGVLFIKLVFIINYLGFLMTVSGSVIHPDLALLRILLVAWFSVESIWFISDTYDNYQQLNLWKLLK